MATAAMESLEDMFSDKQLVAFVKRMQSPLVGVPLQDRKSNGKHYKNCFYGSECTAWVMKDLHFTREEATSLCQTLLDQRVLLALSDTKLFLDEPEAPYGFRESARPAKVSDRTIASPTQSRKAAGSSQRSGLVVGLEAIPIVDIRDQVQRQLFGLDEEVRTVTRVSRPKKLAAKSSASTITGAHSTERELICLTVKAGERLHIQRIKYTHGTYSISTTWKGEDLKSVNQEENSETGFLLAFDKPFLFHAETATDRNEFLWRLIQVYQDVMKRMPTTSIEILELRLLLESDGVKNLESGSSEESRFITEEEERQIEDLLKSRLMGDVHDIDRLSEELSKEVIRLETENITDLIKSHSSIKDIWSGLGAAQKQLTNISAQFDGYKRVLDSTASSFEQIEQKNNRMGVITKNQNTLLTELDDLLRKITLDRGTVNVLENSTFDGGKALEETIRAASGLDKVLKSDLESGVSKMRAVGQQVDMFLRLRGEFSIRLRAFMNDFFKRLADARVKEGKRGLAINDHYDSVVRPLQPYKPLIHWLKTMEYDIKHNPKLRPPVTEATPVGPQAEATSVSDDYARYMQEVYRQEFKSFFRSLNKICLREKAERLTFRIKALDLSMRGKGSSGDPTSRYRSSRSSMDLTEADFDETSMMDASEDDDSDTFSDRSMISSGAANNPALSAILGKSAGKKDKIPIVSAYSVALSTILPSILSEQQYLVEFFRMSVVPDKEGPNAGKSEVDRFMDSLFHDVLLDLTKLIRRAVKYDQFSCVSLWVESVSQEEQYRDKATYATYLTGECKKVIESQFTSYISDQTQYIKDTKISSSKSAGVLDTVKRFPDFVDHMEEHGASKGRQITDSAYDKVSGALFDWLQQHEDDEFGKYVLRFENFHFIYREIGQRKVPALQKYVDKAKKIHDESLDAFIKLVISKRFTSLVDFFDGVDKFLRSMPPENVQFQNSHSNQVITKLISKWDQETFESGLYKEYKRVQREMSETEGLQNRVWLALKDSLTNKYQHFEELVRECYRQQQLAFPSKELKAMFTRVEQKWVAKKSAKNAK